MKTDQIIKEFKAAHSLSTPVEMMVLGTIQDQVEIIEACSIELKKHQKESKLAYGLTKANGHTFEHPSSKIKKDAQKIILSCLRQLNIKEEKVKDKEKPKGLMKMMGS